MAVYAVQFMTAGKNQKLGEHASKDIRHLYPFEHLTKVCVRYRGREITMDTNKTIEDKECKHEDVIGGTGMMLKCEDCGKYLKDEQ